MSIAEVRQSAEQKMQKSIEALKASLAKIRTGRAHAGLLDHIMVDYYGTATPINQVATISVPEPRLLLIAPWYKSAVQQIERAIQKSDLGLTPISDGNVVRLSIPTLTEERRRDFIKVLHKKAEEHRVAVRNVRRDANEHLKKLLKEHEVSEDDEKHALAEVQKLTDHHIEEINEALKKKEAEIMEV